MQTQGHVSRRSFLATVGATMGVAATGSWSLRTVHAGAITTPHQDIAALRGDIVRSPVGVGLHRAKVFTEVFQETPDRPWVERKAAALRKYFETVPLYLREHDGLVGSISETPGAMPVMVELGIAENGGYTAERPHREGYLADQVPEEIRRYWMNRNMWGQYRIDILGEEPVESPDDLTRTANYKFLSNQGHLSPSFGELLQVGIGGMLGKVGDRQSGESDTDRVAFLNAAEDSLLGLSTWARRYGRLLLNEATVCREKDREAELREMSRIATKIATAPPETFREAMQLLWLAHQAVHIEGHGYSCTPDHIDQLLLPFYTRDKQAGRITDDQVIRLAENFVLKMADNTFWGPEHNLTQGFCLGGSTADGRDLTNRLSWLFLEGATNLSLPEPLIWIRWSPSLDQKFFDFALSRLEHSTCFPLMWNDNSVPYALMELGVAREDAFNYIAAGCNELAIPGQMYFNPGAGAYYLKSIEGALSGGAGYRGTWNSKGHTPPVTELKTFEQFSDAVGSHIRRFIERSYEEGLQTLDAQMRWGHTPLTSCFFDDCIEKAQDLTAGTKYNILSCGGTSFANAVDCIGAIKQIVFEEKQATLAEVATACAANFEGYEALRAQLLAAPKHGNDDPRLEEVIRLVESLRDVPMKEICRDPRDGSRFGNCHVVRSSSVRGGLFTPATPDGRLSGVPLASSMAAAHGCERSGPTAVLNSVTKLNAVKSWQSGYQVNIRFHVGMVNNAAQRAKLRAMLNVYFAAGGQELQINVVDSKALRAAQKDPDRYQDLVVRVAGFSEFFVNLTPEMQNEIISRTEHM